MFMKNKYFYNSMEYNTIVITLFRKSNKVLTCFRCFIYIQFYSKLTLTNKNNWIIPLKYRIILVALRKSKNIIKFYQTSLLIGLRRMKVFACFLIVAVLIACVEARKKQPKQTFQFDKRDKIEDQPVYINYILIWTSMM